MKAGAAVGLRAPYLCGAVGRVHDPNAVLVAGHDEQSRAGRKGEREGVCVRDGGKERWVRERWV
jgi:hypothetical protein